MFLMKSKNKIMDSFEEFIALPLSILKNRIIQITGFKSDFVSSKSIDVELSEDTVQINASSFSLKRWFLISRSSSVNSTSGLAFSVLFLITGSL